MAPRFALGQKWIYFPPAIAELVLMAHRWPGKAGDFIVSVRIQAARLRRGHLCHV